MTLGIVVGFNHLRALLGWLSVPVAIRLYFAYSLVLQGLNAR